MGKDIYKPFSFSLVSYFSSESAQKFTNRWYPWTSLGMGTYEKSGNLDIQVPLLKGSGFQNFLKYS